MSYFLHLVDVALDCGEHDVVDIADVRERAGDRARLGEIEPDAPRATADLLRRGRGTGLVPARHDDVAAVGRVRLRHLAPEPLRAADHDHASHAVSPSSRSRAGSPRRGGEPGPFQTV